MDTARLLTDFTEPPARGVSSTEPPAHHTHRDDPALGAFLSRFRTISRRTRELWQHPVLQSPVLSPWHGWGQQALTLSQSICAELTAFAASPPAHGESSIATGMLGELLSANEALLDWLSERMQFADRFRPLVQQWSELVVRIARGQESARHGLHGLAAEFTEAVRVGPELTIQTAADVQGLRGIFTSAGDRQNNAVTQAMLTAWWLARVDNETGNAAESRRRMVIAALVQDIGRVAGVMAAEHGASIANLTGFHPATGAAILAGLQNIPAEIPLLVGAHHERCDGSGFPQRLSGPRLSASAQKLAWTVRYAELVLDPSTADAAVQSGEAIDVLAGIRIWRDVDRGAFDRGIAHAGFHTIRRGLVDEVVARYPQHSRHFSESLPFNSSRTRPARIDDAATAPIGSGPRFLNRRGKMMPVSKPNDVSTMEGVTR